MVETESLRIMLVDDHVFFRSGVKTELSVYPQYKVVGETKNGSYRRSPPAEKTNQMWS